MIKLPKGISLFPVLFFLSSAWPQQSVPALTGRIVDETSTLSAASKSAIDEQCASLEQRKGSQIAVLIIASTAPEEIAQYSLRVAETWKLGRKGVDDGVLFLVAIKDRALRIEVGYGLEGALTDAASKRIIEEIVVPHFKQGNFDVGIRAGVDAIIKVIDGEPLPAPAERKKIPHFPEGWALVLLCIVCWVAPLIFGSGYGPLGAGGAAAVVIGTISASVGMGIISGIIFGLFSLLTTLGGSGRSNGSSFWSSGGGFSGGGGSFGGGGGFSGGGGGFGGGGASGGW
jgi:uncharacterized protein